MDKKDEHAQRIYDVFLWLHAPQKPPHTNLQLASDLEDVKAIMDRDCKDMHPVAAQRKAVEIWMSRYVFPSVAVNHGRDYPRGSSMSPLND